MIIEGEREIEPDVLAEPGGQREWEYSAEFQREGEAGLHPERVRSMRKKA